MTLFWRTREILADVLIAAAVGTGADADSAARDLILSAADAAAGVITDAAKAILPSSLTGSEESSTSPKTHDLTFKPSGKRRDGE